MFARKVIGLLVVHYPGHIRHVVIHCLFRAQRTPTYDTEGAGFYVVEGSEGGFNNINLIHMSFKSCILCVCTYCPAVRQIESVSTTSRVIKLPPHRCPSPKLKVSSILFLIEAKYVTDSERATVPLRMPEDRGNRQRIDKRENNTIVILM